MSLQPRRPGTKASTGGSASPTRWGPQPSSFLPRGPRELRWRPEPARKLTHCRPAVKARSRRASACCREGEGNAAGGGTGDAHSAEPCSLPGLVGEALSPGPWKPPSRFFFPVSRISICKQEPPAGRHRAATALCPKLRTHVSCSQRNSETMKIRENLFFLDVFTLQLIS